MLVRGGGAEGSRTLTGWNLNPVPLPVGLRPRVVRSQGSRTCGRRINDLPGPTHWYLTSGGQLSTVGSARTARVAGRSRLADREQGSAACASCRRHSSTEGQHHRLALTPGRRRINGCRPARQAPETVQACSRNGTHWLGTVGHADFFVGRAAPLSGGTYFMVCEVEPFSPAPPISPTTGLRDTTILQALLRHRPHRVTPFLSCVCRASSCVSSIGSRSVASTCPARTTRPSRPGGTSGGSSPGSCSPRRCSSSSSRSLPDVAAITPGAALVTARPRHDTRSGN